MAKSMGSDSIDFSNDEAEYQALMMNGVTEAKQFKLAPGVALSAAQVANQWGQTPLISFFKHKYNVQTLLITAGINGVRLH